MLDLGAGTSFNLLDFFNYSPGKIVLFTSQATSLQNAYGFIKSALYRKIARVFSKDVDLLDLLYQNAEGDPQGGAGTVGELLARVRELLPHKFDRLGELLTDFQVFLVANMLKSNSDLKSPEIIQSVCADFLNIQPEIMGHVLYDSAVEAAVNQMSQFPVGQKKSKAGDGLAQIALRIVKESMLPRSNWRPVSDEPEEAEVSLNPLEPQPSYTQ